MASVRSSERHPLPSPPPSHDAYPQDYSQQDYSQEYQSQGQQQHPSQQQQQQQPYGQAQSQSYGSTQAARQSLTTAQQQQYQAAITERANSGFFYNQPSQQQGGNARSKPRTFSNHSHRSKTSDTHETPEEKDRNRLHSKADPTLAMNEAEPSAVAAMRSQSSTAPLRSLQHRDSNGNPISDPDRSNPTRSRWERPLDTIRSFDEAINGGYTRRHSVQRADTDGPATWNRRSSMAATSYQPRLTQRDSYYGGPGSRPMSVRNTRSQYGMSTPGTARNSIVYEGQGMPGMPYQQPPSSRHSRRDLRGMGGQEPGYPPYGRDPGVYPMPNKDRSYETVTSAAASGNSDPAGYQTDPTSSDNSSIRRASPPKRKEVTNDYGVNFSQSQAFQPNSFSNFSHSSSHLAAGHNSHPLPPPPEHDVAPTVPRKAPTALLRRQPSRQPAAQPEAPVERRKSWLSRRFSRN